MGQQKLICRRRQPSGRALAIVEPRFLIADELALDGFLTSGQNSLDGAAGNNRPGFLCPALTYFSAPQAAVCLPERLAVRHQLWDFFVPGPDFGAEHWFAVLFDDGNADIRAPRVDTQDQ